MLDYLCSAFIKLERANRRIEELEGEIDTFLNEEANATLVYEDPEEADAFRRQHNSRDVPLRFSVTAGEVLYHLRSSLDHLACDLIRRNGGSVTPQSQFPIFTFKPTKRKGMARYRDQVSGIAAEPAAMIEALQPYHRGEDGSAHFLAVLKSLSNFEKHNSLAYCLKTETSSSRR